MYRLTLAALVFAFAFSFNNTWSQVTSDSLVKKPEVTKSITKTKATVTQSTDKSKIGTTQTFEVHKIESTKSIDKKKIELTKEAELKKNSTIQKPQVTKGTGTPVNKMCIVSGEDIDSKITADYKGATYAFCCKTCLKKFTADPEKYVSKLDSKSLKLKN
jgi:YHS domain-containing protein